MNSQEFQEGLETEQGQPRRVRVLGTGRGGPSPSLWQHGAFAEAGLTEISLGEASLWGPGGLDPPCTVSTVVSSQQGEFQAYPLPIYITVKSTSTRQADFARTICLDDAVL